ncbi:hypothetical protein ACQ4PT_028222 [Festuca glaucescens]
MPISSTLSARLGPGPAPSPSPSPAPARWSPYARPSEPRGAGVGGGCVKASRPALSLDPATARLLGPARKAPARRSSYAAEVPAPTRRLLADEKSNQKTDPKPAETNRKPNHVQESCGGFAFLCALAGHTEAITGISMPIGSDKLYSGSADGTVRLWDYNSGKVAGLSALNISFRFFVHGSAWGCFSTNFPIACGG